MKYYNLPAATYGGCLGLSLDIYLLYICMLIASNTVLLNYNFIFNCVSMCGATRKPDCIPVTCLYGTCFLVAWNIHVSHNLPCATHGIATCRIANHGITTCGVVML